MKDNSRMRDAQMMNAVAGMGGRNALSSEVDLRLGLTPNVGSAQGWFGAFIRRMRSRTTVQSAAGSDSSAAETQNRTPFWVSSQWWRRTQGRMSFFASCSRILTSLAPTRGR